MYNLPQRDANSNLKRLAAHVNKPTASQPSNQQTSQPASQPANRPTNQPTNQPANQPISQPANQPTSQPTNQPTKQAANQPTDQPMGAREEPSGAPRGTLGGGKEPLRKARGRETGATMNLRARPKDIQLHG
jgi:hypothetical protein